MVSPPRARSAPFSRPVMPSARVTLPGPLASRGVPVGTPRRRAITARPTTGSTARIRTQPGRSAVSAIAFRHQCSP